MDTVQEIVAHSRRVAETLGVDLPEDLLTFGHHSVSDSPWYLIGLIGGKDVGKSAFVNALVGESISESSAFGEGTDRVVAYVHANQSASVKKFLETEAPGRYELVVHEEDRLDRQVLLDLPDIDSHYRGHFETVRDLLRFILFPIWIQSVEKYADRQPMELLRKVVHGNSPENFLYCLNKADQVLKKDGPEALKEIAADYQARIAQSLGLDSSDIAVHAISTIEPEGFDFPTLRKILSRQKEQRELDSSRSLAERQFGLSLLQWVGAQNLAGRAESAGRMEEELGNLLHHRVERPIAEYLLPSIQRDESVEHFLFSQTFRARIQRWPIVRWIDTLGGPLLRLIPIGSGAVTSNPKILAKEAVDRGFAQVDPPVYRSVQASFAHCRGSSPRLAEMYASHPLWEEREAKVSAGNLRTRLIDSMEVFLSRSLDRLVGSGTALGSIFRYFIVLGALVWFPFGQPIVQTYLEEGSLSDIPLLVVSLLGVSSLLSSAIFLVFFYAVLWMAVRWKAKLSVDRVLSKTLREGDGGEGAFDEILLEWGQTLVGPLEEERAKIHQLISEGKRLEQELGSRG